MTLQEVFDNALFGIRQQGYKRSIANSGCAYSSLAGHCSIGHSFAKAGIDGGLLDRVMACTSVQSLLETQRFSEEAEEVHKQAAKIELGKVEALFQGLETPALMDLQSIHDDLLGDTQNPGAFEAGMASFASDRGLTYTPA